MKNSDVTIDDVMKQASMIEDSTRQPRVNDVMSHSSTCDDSLRQQRVSVVNVYGVDIVCLLIDGAERLCLAQISSTLLKAYSYNEIHNRRVALGITCVQCTPVQLEILRRRGAMPVTSRRCGMITKREAERLVKSFLEEASPPKLATTFRFEIKHECGWGGQGQFMPCRYNSARAKCVQCSDCKIFFSPNKFIFHSHQRSDATYRHPDAANFNSWRRHLMLVNPDNCTDLLHAWEDVKAMFNGGNKRRMSAISSSSSASRRVVRQPGRYNSLVQKPTTVLQQPLPTTYSGLFGNTVPTAVLKPIPWKPAPHAVDYHAQTFHACASMTAMLGRACSGDEHNWHHHHHQQGLHSLLCAPADVTDFATAAEAMTQYGDQRSSDDSAHVSEAAWRQGKKRTDIFRPYALDD